MINFKIHVSNRIIIICIGWSLLCIACFISSCGFFSLSIGMILIFWGKNDVVNKVCSCIVQGVIVCGVYLKIFVYDFIPQAYVLLKVNENVLFWIDTGHIHAIRLLIAYPSYLMSQFFDIELNLAFSYYCTIVFALLYYFLTLILKIYKVRSGVSNCIVFIFIVILCTVMNGRVSFAFLGFAVLTYEMTVFYLIDKPGRWFERYAKLLGGVLLCTVSSGIMVESIGFIVTIYVMRTMKYRSWGKVRWGIIRLLIICIIFSRFIYNGIAYVIFMINKNITYFDGKLLNLLQHGLGKIFGVMSGPFALLMCMIGIIVLSINIMMIIKIYRTQCSTLTLILGSNLSFYGLFVGISTGSIILIPLLLLLLIRINKILTVRRNNNLRRSINV